MNFLKGISDKKLQKSEFKLMEYSGLKPEEFELLNVNISNGDHIHTLICGKGTVPLVMIHGYGGSCMFFYKIYQYLAPHFKIYSIDLLGMGSSSRPNYTAKNVHESEQFFIKAINEWRQAMDLEQFVLAGHSFGGYISGVYALEFPQQIIKLLLLSPVGIPNKPEGYNFDEDAAKKIGKSRTKKLLLRFAKYMYRKKVSPFSIMRKSSRLIAPCFLKGYMKRRLSMIEGKENKVLGNHLYQILMRKGSGEYALLHILELGAWAVSPLQARLVDITVPVTFLFGDVDWMDPTAAYALVDKVSVPLNVEIVAGCGHHLYFDNPTSFAQSILNNLEVVLNPNETAVGKLTPIARDEMNPEIGQLVEEQFKEMVIAA